MDNYPLLSVIVPCYNVEKYIDKCISSIVSQTYSNLEIILINDGSYDNTGAICDVWREKDKRIRVIHKQNEGQSYARKTGFEASTAEYIAFVDSDDWIDIKMYTDMMSALLKTNSDIAMCNYCTVYGDGQKKHRANELVLKGTFEILDRVEAITKITTEHSWTTFWIYIFRRTLFEQVVFPKGRGYAEEMIIHYMFHKAKQTVFVDHEYYFYLIRNDSVSRIGGMKEDMKRCSEISDGYFERYSFVKQYPEYSNILPYVKGSTINWKLMLIRNMVAVPQYFTKEYFKVKVEQLNSIPINIENRFSRKIKLEIKLIKFSPTLYKILRGLYNCIIRATNKLKITNKRIIYIMEW